MILAIFPPSIVVRKVSSQLTKHWYKLIRRYNLKPMIIWSVEKEV